MNLTDEFQLSTEKRHNKTTPLGRLREETYQPVPKTTKDLRKPITTKKAKSIYFAHPPQTYSTEEALEILKALKREYPNHNIIDPEDLWIPRANWKSCDQCMNEYMKSVIFPTIKACEIFAIWAPWLKTTCNLECEIHYAAYLSKFLIHIAYFAGETDFEEMTLKDHHHMTRDVIQ